MPTLADAARIAGNPRPGPVRRTHRRTVMRLAGPGIRAARDVYTTIPPRRRPRRRPRGDLRRRRCPGADGGEAAPPRPGPDRPAPLRPASTSARVLGRGRWLPP